MNNSFALGAVPRLPAFYVYLYAAWILKWLLSNEAIRNIHFVYGNEALNVGYVDDGLSSFDDEFFLSKISLILSISTKPYLR